ncbi:MAG: LytTR family DNA-binding domain-containing protein [Pseudomonadota bacterium]
MKSEVVRGLGFAVVAGSLVALSGLFGTGTLNLPVAWLYWTGLIGLGVWIGAAISVQIEPLLRPMPWMLQWLTYSVAMTVPMFGFVTVAQALIGYPIPLEGFISAGFKVWVVTAAITGIRMRDRGRRREGAPPAAIQEASLHEEDTQAEPGLPSAALPAPVLRRAKPELRGAKLLALSSEDHYIRLHTDQGEDLVLLRLSDAIGETGDLEGLQVHRSWWVAKDGIASITKRTEGGTITLTSGAEAPISRRSMAQVKEAGWLDA